MFCSRCGREIKTGSLFCEGCGNKIDGRVSDKIPTQTMLNSEQNKMFVNTSGQGKAAIVPEEIKKWNWGAFILGSYMGVR